MSKTTELLSALGFVSLSFAMGAVGFTVKLEPRWLNDIIPMLSVPSVLFGTHWFLKALKRYFVE
jgi:hypothetical protein